MGANPAGFLQRTSRWWLVGYVTASFLALPIALPCWNWWLERIAGRWLGVEAIHVIQYLGLGWLATLARRTIKPGRRRRLAFNGLLAGVGLMDELVQGWLPQRFFEWSDVGLNWAGLLLGVGLSEMPGWVLELREAMGWRMRRGRPRDDV